MNYEAKMIFLRRLADEVRDEHLALVPTDAGIHTDAFKRLMAKVNRWEEQIKRFEARVKSDLHGAQVRINHSGRRTYAARQSLQSHADNAASLRSAAAAVSARIAELLERLHPDSLAWKALIESFHKIMTETGEDIAIGRDECHELQIVMERIEPGSAPPPPGHPGSVGVVHILTFALALLVVLKRNLK